MKLPISAVVAIAFGLIVLLGYFIPLPLLTNLKDIFVQWGMIVASTALFIGVANLMRVHWGKIRQARAGSAYSIILVASLLVTLVVVGLFGPTAYWSMWIFNNIQLPIESSLMAILAVVLIYSAARLLRRRIDLFSVVFTVVVLIILLGAGPIFGIEIPGLQGPNGLRALVMQVPALAGARGILLGVALGTIATGLRVLMGVDRPYGR
ncbi:MAG: hypothetical protein ACWGO1_07515 [Anaerolineales bacterium]